MRTKEDVAGVVLNSLIGRPMGLIKKIRSGIPFRVLADFQKKNGFSTAEIASILRIPERTLGRRKLERRLRPVESERLVRFLRIWKKSTDLFEGDQAGARIWLSRPKKALAGHAPLELLDTDVGTEEVSRLIGRLEHGVFS